MVTIVGGAHISSQPGGAGGIQAEVVDAQQPKSRRARTPASREQTEADFLFSERTFAYFDTAARNATKRAWLDKNKARFEADVEVPFTHLILELKAALEPLLPGFTISPRRLSKPWKRGKAEGDGRVRANCYAAFSEPSESMFDTNPGLYLDVGAEECLIGCGLYEVSSRQMRALRPALLRDHAEMKRLLANRTLRRHWKCADGSLLQGSRYTRFPKDLDQTAPGAEYLWQRQWLLARTLTREDVMHPKFAVQTVAAFRAAVPWLAWTRHAVGVWKRPKPSHEELY